MLHDLRLWAIGFVCLLFVPGAALAQDDDLSKQIDRLFTRWDRKDSPGCAVVVIHEGKIVHQRGYGMANLELSVLNRPTTAFNIASVSKQFTAFLILLLASAGLIDLDASVRTYVPEVPDFGKTITVRHLVHHTSGLREEWDLLTLSGWRPEDSIQRRDTLTLLKRQTSLNFDPGAEYSYCNTGYTLLAEIVERVTKKSIRAAAQERIFGPLGMNDTVFQDDPRQLIPHRAASYQPKGKEFENVPYATGRAGPGNLYATALDLAKWDANFYEPKVGGAVLTLMHERGRLNGAKQIPYAAGLMHGKYRGLDMVGHGGAIAGYRSVIARFPKERFTVILLSNVSDFAAQTMGQKVIDIFLKEKLGAATDAKDLPKKKQETTAKLSPEELQRFAGEYYCPELDTLYRLVMREDRLVVVHRRGESPLRPVGANEFRGEIASPVAIRFTSDGDRPPSSFTVSTERTRNLRFNRASIKVGS